MISDLNTLKTKLRCVSGLNKIIEVSKIELDIKTERLIISVPTNDDASVLRHRYSKVLAKNSFNICDAIDIRCEGQSLYYFEPKIML